MSTLYPVHILYKEVFKNGEGKTQLHCAFVDPKRKSMTCAQGSNLYENGMCILQCGVWAASEIVPEPFLCAMLMDRLTDKVRQVSY